MFYTLLDLFWSVPLFVSGIFIGLLVAALSLFVWPFNPSLALKYLQGGLATSAVCVAFTTAFTIVAGGFTIVVVWVAHLFRGA